MNYATHELEANNVAQDIVQAGGKGVAIRADVSKIEDVRRLFEKVNERFGLLDRHYGSRNGSSQMLLP